MSVVFGGVRRSLPSSDIFQPSHSFSSNSLKSFRTQSASLNRGQSLTPITNYSTQPRRMTNTVRASNISAILAVGEELRQLLHAEDPPIIKDRRYHLKVYENCFVGHEMVDWLLRKGEVESRAEAVAMMQKLLENEVIHHVCDDHEFKDEKLFFRFRRDDNTYEEPPDAMIVAKGQRIYSRLRTDGSNLIQDRKYHLQTFKQCFIGREFIDWLITRGEVNTREEGVDLGRQFIEAGVFRHVCDDHHFKDEYLFFRFKNDDPRKKSFGKRVGVSRGKKGSIISSEDGHIHTPENRHSGGSYSSSNTSDNLGVSGTPPDPEDEYIDMQSVNDESGYVQMRPSPEPTSLQPPAPQAARQQSANHVTIEELLDPNGRFVEHSINVRIIDNGWIDRQMDGWMDRLNFPIFQVVSDPVGYGFVIRGSRPVYVHTVDPSGPAASAGLQVREYLHYVNGQDVLDKSHTDVARIILMGSSTASLVTFVEKDRLPSN